MIECYMNMTLWIIGDISAEEVLRAVKSLKSGKSCGIDEIYNEMLKMSVLMFITFNSSYFYSAE